MSCSFLGCGFCCCSVCCIGRVTQIIWGGRFLFFSTEGSFGPRLRDVRLAKGTATCVFLSSQEKDCSAVSPSAACSRQVEHFVPTLFLKLLSDLIFASLTRDPKCHTAKGIFPSTPQEDCQLHWDGQNHSMDFGCKLI